MEILKIKKNHHYCYDDIDLRIFYLFKNKLFSISNSYIFTEDSRYETGEDQSDVNKLIGISFGYHHKNSVRLGFRYDGEKYQAVAYVYKNGCRIKENLFYFIEGDIIDINIAAVRINNKIKVTISVCKDNNIFENRVYVFEDKFWNRIMYKLGLYFGGNRTAPKDILIKKINKNDVLWKL